MDIRTLSVDDAGAVVAAAALLDTAGKVDAPFNHPVTVEEYLGHVRHGWDGEVPEVYGAWVGDDLVGLLELHTSEWDNRHLVWTAVTVHPDHRRAGFGSRLWSLASERATELGRTSIGSDAWEGGPGPAFAARHRLPCRSSAIKRRQVLERLDRRELREMHDDAASTADAYELVHLAGRTPPDLVNQVSVMAEAINDAPTDALDVEDEAYPVERIVAYEAAQEARGHRLYRVLARHRESGELAGHTVVAVEGARPWIGDQHDTSVVRSHRGHRLGMLLKLDMLRWLAEAEPELATIDTWNTESNGFMIGVNERLGYVVLGRELQFQRDI